MLLKDEINKMTFADKPLTFCSICLKVHVLLMNSIARVVGVFQTIGSVIRKGTAVTPATNKNVSRTCSQHKLTQLSEISARTKRSYWLQLKVLGVRPSLL